MSLHQSAYACVLACTYGTLSHIPCSTKDCNIYIGFYTYLNGSAKAVWVARQLYLYSSLHTQGNLMCFTWLKLQHFKYKKFKKQVTLRRQSADKKGQLKMHKEQ